MIDSKEVRVGTIVEADIDARFLGRKYTTGVKSQMR